MTTPIADMVRRMLEKGVEHEAILIAIEGVEQAMLVGASTRHPPDIVDEDPLEKRRAWDREYRKRKRMSGGCPPDSTRTPPESGGHPSLSKELKEEREVASTGRPHRIPPEWQPSTDDRGFAKTESFAETEIDREISKFRDYWISVPGGKGVKLDWSPMWRKWIRDGADRRKREPSAGRSVASSSSTVAPSEETEKFWTDAITSWKKFQRWPTQYAGPDPESLACRCPRELLDKHGVAYARQAAE